MDNPLDLVLIAALLVWIVARQFTGRYVPARRRLVLPLILGAVGVEQLVTAHVPLPAFAIALVAGDLLLTAALGAARGATTRLTLREGHLYQRGGGLSLVLWLVSIGARLLVALPFEHTAAGPALTASLTLSFGVSLAAQYLVFDARVRADGRPLRGVADRPAQPARATLRR